MAQPLSEQTLKDLFGAGAGESWLRADYSLRCTTGGCVGDAAAAMTPEYAEAYGVASSILVVYALGVPLVYAQAG